MTETLTTGADTEPELSAELAQLEQGFDRLLDRLGRRAAGLDDDALMAVLRRFERFRNRLPLADHRLVNEVLDRQLPERLLAASPGRFLSSTLRVSAGEAQRRLRAAAALSPEVSPSGVPVPPRRPMLAAAQQAGAVSPDQVAIIERALRSVDRPGFDPADVATGEQLLTEWAGVFEPRELHQLATKVVDAINPDGTRPDEERVAERRHFRLRPQPDGGYTGEFRLTGALGAKLQTLLGPLARPRTDTSTTPDGPARADDSTGADETAADGSAAAEAGNGPAQVDGRHHGQRMHDALEEVCDRLLRSGTLPDCGGVPSTVIITVDHDDLRDRTGHGITGDGQTLSITEILGLAGEAEVLPVVRTAVGAVLGLGRSRRIASPAQTCALIARDGGCSFPGCDRAPQWCERHHIHAWIDGGLTDLDNLTLLCRFHHHNFAQRGWFCQMNEDGLPEWLPPRWVDPNQTPRLHPRILATAAAAQARRHPALC